MLELVTNVDETSACVSTISIDSIKSNENGAVADKVRILTVNFFMRPPLIRNNASDHKEARLAYFIEHVLPKFDIICLQEMFQFGSSRRHRLLEAAYKAGFKFSWSSPAKSLFSGSIDGGLVLLSKFPLRECDYMVYPVGCYSDRFSDKGALYAKVGITQTNFIHIFVTHTQASYTSAPAPNDQSVIIRHRQFAMLREFIDKCTIHSGRKPEELIILMGDLNVNGRPQFDPSNPEVVKGDSTEYKCMIKILCGEGIEAPLANPKLNASDDMRYTAPTIINVHDLLWQRYNFHPVTFGDVFTDEKGHVQPRETVLTSKSDWKTTASLDYILLIDEKTDDDNLILNKRLINVDLEQTKIEKFFTNSSEDKQELPFTQLSDHYGASIMLKIKSQNIVPYVL
ncbi:hypothetical protein G9A89_013035 [Geosiphon pyriformis]|nr:hypothetical protein G9A89_013035 [Geosiphon pyriformis]